MTPAEHMNLAWQRLAERPGFTQRDNQLQLAMLLSDCIEEKAHSMFEAPTGLGKSLAALIPAIAHALDGKRVVVATYTNVLAEQYWHKDLPLALSLFDEAPRTVFLIGRQRYLCQMSLNVDAGDIAETVEAGMKLGLETEFRNVLPRHVRRPGELWQKLAAPPVCPARLCPFYNSCYYYKARRAAERAEIVITNHSVVLQDAQLKDASGDDLSLLGKYDYLVVDEAHDFPTAAVNAFEFELSDGRLSIIAALAAKMERAIAEAIPLAGVRTALESANQGLAKRLARVQVQLGELREAMGISGVLRVEPDALGSHPALRDRMLIHYVPRAEAIASEAAEAIRTYLESAERVTGKAEDLEARPVAETVRNYAVFLKEFAMNCERMFFGAGASVTYAGDARESAMLRRDVVDVAPLLRDMLWEKVPAGLMSATMAVDGGFDFMQTALGFDPKFAEILDSPFDFSTQAALYVPRRGAVPDATEARKTGSEAAYYQAIARELSAIIRLAGGRTLALFHSRKEMEGVAALMDLPDDLPILVQRQSGHARLGEQFKANRRASLFGLRSFWTGFDAPGDTLSCIAVVRVPFEVPVDPPALTRHAWIASQGQSPFAAWSLPNAKMMLRQGVGRLIRRSEDVGLIAILDARIRLKTYGEELLANLPPGMREFDNIEDALAHVGLIEEPLGLEVPPAR